MKKRIEIIRACLGPKAVLLVIEKYAKKPKDSAWQQIGIERMSDPEYLARLDAADNIGVGLGKQSDGLGTIDFDGDEAMKAFQALNPGLDLDATLWTKRVRGGNCWVQFHGLYPSSGKLYDEHGQPIGEFRATGSQTVISGEAIDRKKGETAPTKYRVISTTMSPARVSFSEIQWPVGWQFPWEKPARRDRCPTKGENKPSKDEVREMLAVTPKGLPHDEWIRIIAAVGDALCDDDAVEVLNEWDPQDEPGKYAYKLAHRLTSVTFRTLIYMAKEYGWKGRKMPSNDISARMNSATPKVQLPGDDRLLSAFAEDLAGVLRKCGMYQYGGLVFIVNQRGDGLELMTAQRLRTLAEEHLVCYRMRRTGETDAMRFKTMSVADAEGVLCAPQFLSLLPRVEKVETARLPVMRQDGGIVLLPAGYDAESLTLTLPQCEYDEGMPLAVAKEKIDALLSEFPFADRGRSKAVAFSAMVGLFGAGLLAKGQLRPAFIYLANREGAGKTMLAKCAIFPTHSWVKTDGDLKEKEETRKELLTAVIEARLYILFDNCKGHLDSSHLEGFLTAVDFRGRVLGASKSFCGPNNVTVPITGNGCTVSPDMRRRCLFVELFMRDERAEDRKFQRELDEAALFKMRPEILAALWAFVREWDTAGRPKASRTHSGFPQWAEIIGGIVECAGYGCPLETAEIPGASDVDGADMRELVKLLDNGEAVKFDELTNLAQEHGLFERIIGCKGDELKVGAKSAFGKLLKKYNGTLFGGWWRFLVDGKGHCRSFRVVTEG